MGGYRHFKSEYRMDKILLEFNLLSTLLVLQKVVYLIRQNEPNKFPLLLNCLVYDFLFSSILS